jgi:ElaB protein
MNSTRNGPAQDTQTLKEAARAAARRAHASGNVEVENLVAEVEQLIDRLGTPADPGIASICTRVAEAVQTVRRTLNARAGQVQRQAREALTVSDSYVHEQPWQAIGAAAVAGLLLGLLVYRR